MPKLMAPEINKLRELCKAEHIEITLHTAKRLEQRGISVDDVISCISTGEIIENYPDDYPYPSCLVLGKDSRGEALHVVVGTDGNALWIVTTYHPDTGRWQIGFKERKGNKS